MGSSIYVRDVNAVGVRVADGEVALEGERDDHEDGRGHEDLSSIYMCNIDANLTFITYCNHPPSYSTRRTVEYSRAPLCPGIVPRRS